VPHPIASLDPATPPRHLIRLVVPICRRAEPRPPPGPGHLCGDPRVSRRRDGLIAVAKRLNTKSAQYRCLRVQGLVWPSTLSGEFGGHGKRLTLARHFK